jgi:hypothetical protein
MADQARSRSERLDPGGESRRRAEGLAALASPPWSGFLKALGVTNNVLAQAQALLTAHDAGFGGLDDDADLLAPHGWLLFELSPHAAYRDAAALVRAGRVQEAEQRIVDSWNEHDAALLRLAVHRVDGLYREFDPEYESDPDAPDVGRARAAVIEEAVECHRDGRYAAAINLALGQIDGIVADFSDDGHPFFARDRNTHEPRANVTDDTTLAGHPRALLALAKLMTEACNSTAVTGRLLRHGIMHGRELGYASRRNSTQALATLLAVIVWAQPIFRARIDAAHAQREAACAGTNQRDEHGRRLWRAGFAEAKRGLHTLADYQDRFHEQHGRYAASVEEIDPSGLLREDFPRAGTASEEGQRYLAWAHTGSNYVFGVAGSADDAIRWQYAGEAIPYAGPGSDVDWRHPVNDPAHPDW